MSCSECLSLVTAVTFINIMVFGLGLVLCFSNSNLIFLLIPHFRKLNLIIDFYFVVLSFSPYNYTNNVTQFPNSFPFHPLSNPPNTISSQNTITKNTSFSTFSPISLTQFPHSNPYNSNTLSNHQNKICCQNTIPPHPSFSRYLFNFPNTICSQHTISTLPSLPTFYTIPLK